MIWNEMINSTRIDSDDWVGEKKLYEKFFSGGNPLSWRISSIAFEPFRFNSMIRQANSNLEIRTEQTEQTEQL